MKNWSKVLLITFCAVCLVAASVMGTIAAITAKTQTVTNTFTIGNITLTLDESDVNELGDLESQDRVTENRYKLFANATYMKDPTVHVTEDSESCYIFVVVNNGISAIEAGGEDPTIASQITENGWTSLNGSTEIYWRTHTGNQKVDYKVFDNFTIGDIGINQLLDYKDATITITAYAIQSEGIDTPESAWEQLDPVVN